MRPSRDFEMVRSVVPSGPVNPLPLYFMGYLMLHSDAQAPAVAKLLRLAVEGASQPDIEHAIFNGDFLVGLGAGVLDIPKLASHAIRLAKLPNQAYNVAKFVEVFEPTLDRHWARAAERDFPWRPYDVTNQDD
jgi:hypothetical protein